MNVLSSMARHCLAYGHVLRCTVMSLVLIVVGVAHTAQAAVLRQGAQAFTEQRLLATMTEMYLAKHGYQVKTSWGLTVSMTRPAQLNNELDIVWEYIGTSLIEYHHVEELLDEQQSFQRVYDLDHQLGLTWLSPAFNNTYAIAMSEKVAQKIGNPHTLSDYVRYVRATSGRHHLFAMDVEFDGRADGMPGMSKRYGLNLNRGDKRSMDAGLVYLALQAEQAEAGVVYNTDGRIQAFGLRVLQDDLHYFPAYNVAPIVRSDYLAAHPDLAPLLKALTDTLDESTMRRLNGNVDVDGRSVSQVAREYLVQQHLL